MIERNHINSIDDVPVSITLSRLRFILSEMRAIKKQACEEADEYSRARARCIKEYARTGEVAEFAETASDAGLIGHKDDCTVWEGDELFDGVKCSCGYWEAEA